MWELEKTFTWEDAKAMSANGWELVSVISGGGFYFKKRVSVKTGAKNKGAVVDKARPLRKLSTRDE